MADVPYSKLFGEGDRLVLQLKNETIFEGNYCNSGTNHLELVNARQHNIPNELGGVHSFYRNEIQCIYCFNDGVVERRCRRYPESNIKAIDLAETSYNRLRNMVTSYVYIQQADNKYFKIMKQLVDAENIGVIQLGMKPARCTQIQLLAVCTWRKVILFDLINQKNTFFYPELRNILESEHICKVMHKGSPLIDVLYHKYQIYVQNTFDTEVVDLIIQKSKLGKCPRVTRTLSECLTEYINLPSCFLNAALETSDKSWQDRPLSDSQLHAASQQVTYLMILKHNMEKILSTDIYTTICKVHKFYNEARNSESTSTGQSDEISKNLADLIPTLKQLKVNNEPDTATNSET